MKKAFIILCMAIAAQTACAQGVNTIINKYKSEPRAEYVHVPKLLMKLGAMGTKNEADDIEDRAKLAFMKHISSITVLDLEDCSDRVRRNFTKDVGKLSLEGYETVMEATDDGEKVRMVAKKEGDLIREFLILVTDDDECALIQFKGEITQEDVDKLLKEQGA